MIGADRQDLNLHPPIGSVALPLSYVRELLT